MDELPRRYGDTAFAARYLDMPAATLSYWRATGTGPRWSKLGKRVRYDVADLDAYVEQQKHRAAS